MSDRDMAEAMLNPHRSIEAIAVALDEALDHLGDTETQNVAALVSALTDHEAEIDAIAIPRLMVALGALFAAKTNSAPKQVFEQLWKDAPTDAWWHKRTAPTTREETDE